MTMYLSVTPHIDPTHTLWDETWRQAPAPLRRVDPLLSVKQWMRNRRRH